MYANKLVASLKANGKILREFKDTVYIPFGSEYSFLLKNLHTQRAVVNVFIDGDNVIEGGLVLNAGQEVDLERYVKNGNLTAGNKFKFIERTSAIEDGPRGIKLEDGLIRIEFQYEQPRPVLEIGKKWIPGHYEYDWYATNSLNRGLWNSPVYGGTTGISGSTGDRFSVTASGATCQVNVNGALRGVDYSQGESVKATAASATTATLASMGIKDMQAHDGMATMDWMEAPKNDVGITVPGSKSEQKFTSVIMGAMEAEKHTIVLKLLGETPDNKPVLQPVTTKHKPKCVTCGKQNKATAKFCTECGTALEIFA
jgi:hypothetical protein